MDLRPGVRLECSSCETQVVVVRAPKDGSDVDLRCSGAPLQELGSAGSTPAPAAGGGPGTLLGKRYVDDDARIEVLCTRAGAGPLTVGDAPLSVKDAKPLPSSD